MKIDSVETFVARVGARKHCLVKVRLSSGATGWGEAGLPSKEAAIAAMVGHVRQLLVGRDALRRGALWQEVYRAGYFEGDRTLAAALSAIDIALHDAIGHELGVPVYELLGGRHRDRVPVFPTVGSFDRDESIAAAGALADAGWDVIRLMCLNPREAEGIFDPHESVARTAALVAEVRGTVGARVALGVEFHHRLSLPEAIAFANAVPDGALAFLEEPIRAQSVAAYEALRARVTIPLAIGEEFTSKWEFGSFLDAGVVDYARVDVGNVGGFTEAMKVAALAETRYVDLMPHNPLGVIGTAATAHFALAVPNLSWIEYRGLPGDTLDTSDAQTFTSEHRLDGRALVVASAPGLGVRVEEELLGCDAEPDSFPRLARSDGTYTNW